MALSPVTIYEVFTSSAKHDYKVVSLGHFLYRPDALKLSESCSGYFIEKKAIIDLSGMAHVVEFGSKPVYVKSSMNSSDILKANALAKLKYEEREREIF